jgi:hypothetical protein
MKVTERNNLVIIHSNDDKIILVISKTDAADLHRQLNQFIPKKVSDPQNNQWYTSLSFSGKDMGWGPKNKFNEYPVIASLECNSTLVVAIRVHHR